MLVRRFDARQQMLFVTVYAARRNETEKVERSSPGCDFFEQFDKYRLPEKLARGNIAMNPRQILKDDPAGADI